jgi:hypothetical protein
MPKDVKDIVWGFCRILLHSQHLPIFPESKMAGTGQCALKNNLTSWFKNVFPASKYIDLMPIRWPPHLFPGMCMELWYISIHGESEEWMTAWSVTLIASCNLNGESMYISSESFPGVDSNQDIYLLMHRPCTSLFMYLSITIYQFYL